MTQHKHTWEVAQRLAGDAVQERCACGEARERAMTKAEAAEYKDWRDEMTRLDQEGVHSVVEA